MISGHVALGPLSLEFGNVKARRDELTKVVAGLTERHAALVRNEAEILDQLARLYLPDLSRGTVFSGLKALRADLESALERQARRLEGLRDEAEAAETAVADHRRRVEEAQRIEADKARDLEAARARVEAALASHSEHAQWVEEHRSLLERRELLRRRRSALASAANAERPRYEGDPLFGYLLARSYGEPDYRGGALTSRLDRWLARRIGFDRLVRHYRILLVGPHATHAEIRSIDERASELERDMDLVEDEVSGRTGLLEALAADATAQERLMSARAALEEAETRHDALVEELVQVEANRGGPHEEAIALHTAFLSDRDAQELIELASETPDPRDDALVDRLGQVRSQLERLAAELEDRRHELDRVSGGAARLGDLARTASSRFLSRRSFFPDEFPIGRMVESLLAGAMTTEQSLATLENAHIREPILTSDSGQDVGGLFAELSSVFDRELGAVRRGVLHEIESEVIVRDDTGKVIHRRVTRRGGE